MTKQYDYIVTEDEAGARLDRFITDKMDELSRSFIQKLISAGDVTVSGSSAKPSYNIRPGDAVQIKLPEAQIDLQAEDIPLDILFQDHDVIVVNKPVGMIVHPATGISSGTLVNAVLASISPELTAITPERPGIVHRIDKNTSGLLVVARTVAAYYKLVTQFQEHTVNRKYLTLVYGDLKHDSGIITAPIGRSRRDRKKMAVTPINSKQAITRFLVKERYGTFSLLDIILRTGRTHQIRVHLLHIGYPVVGDPTYGGRNRAIKAATPEAVKLAIADLSRQALHAQTLGFIHPTTDEYMGFSTPIPADIQNVLDALEQMAPEG